MYVASIPIVGFQVIYLDVFIHFKVASSAGAAIGLMRCLKVEGAKYNILANAIATSVDPTKAGADQLLTWLGHRGI